MSLDNFLSFLQQLLSIVNKNDSYSVALAKISLNSTVELARGSGKVDALTTRIMETAQAEFDDLVAHAHEFAGKPGEYTENKKKRIRLRNMLYPSC